MQSDMVEQQGNECPSRKARRQPRDEAPPFLKERRAMSRDEFWRRQKFAESIFDLYIQRRLLVTEFDIHAARYNPDPAAGGDPNEKGLTSVACWVLTVEKVFKAIGQGESLILAARLRRPAVPFEKIARVYRMPSTRDAKERFRFAVIAFTDELRARGIDERVTVPRAA